MKTFVIPPKTLSGFYDRRYSGVTKTGKLSVRYRWVTRKEADRLKRLGAKKWRIKVDFSGRHRKVRGLSGFSGANRELADILESTFAPFQLHTQQELRRPKWSKKIKPVIKKYFETKRLDVDWKAVTKKIEPEIRAQMISIMHSYPISERTRDRHLFYDAPDYSLDASHQLIDSIRIKVVRE